MKRITVGLLGHSLTSDNLGVGALTAAQIAISEAAAERAGARIHYLAFGGANGNMPAMPLEVAVEVVEGLQLKNVVRTCSSFLTNLRKCDLILDISQGDSFTDIYGQRRFLSHSLSKLAVLASRRSLILSPQTIGPFAKALNQFLAVAIMRRCRLVYARDGESLNYLRRLGLMENSNEAIDVAFRLPYQKPVWPQLKGRLRVGVNISSLMYYGGYTRANQFGLRLDYPALAHALLEELTSSDDYEVHLVAHVLASHLPVEDDYALACLLAKKYSGSILARRFETPSAAKSYISGLDFFVGARMHACIAAFSSGVPVIPTAYSRKFMGLFNSLCYPYVADCQEASVEEVLDLIRRGLSDRDLLKQLIRDGNRLASDKLQAYEDFLYELYQEAV